MKLDSQFGLFVWIFTVNVLLNLWAKTIKCSSCPPGFYNIYEDRFDSLSPCNALKDCAPEYEYSECSLYLSGIHMHLYESLFLLPLLFTFSLDLGLPLKFFLLRKFLFKLSLLLQVFSESSLNFPYKYRQFNVIEYCFLFCSNYSHFGKILIKLDRTLALINVARSFYKWRLLHHFWSFWRRLLDCLSWRLLVCFRGDLKNWLGLWR